MAASAASLKKKTGTVPMSKSLIKKILKAAGRRGKLELLKSLYPEGPRLCLVTVIISNCICGVANSTREIFCFFTVTANVVPVCM